jgi:protoheme IX farnesyltransferase
MRFKDDYAAAGVPMLPVVVDAVAVGRRIVGYAWAMVLWSLLLIPAAHTGPVYAASAVLLGGAFIAASHQLLGRAKRGEDPQPMQLFHGSITYLSLLFVAVAIDPLLHF